MAILGYNKSSAALCVYWKASMDTQWIKSNSCYSILANKSPVCVPCLNDTVICGEWGQATVNTHTNSMKRN